MVIADRIKTYLSNWPGTRVIVLAHVKELVKQNAEKLISYWPEGKGNVGIFSAGLNRRDVFQPVIFASIQSVYNKAMQLGRFDLIFIDEAHRIPLEGEGTYLSFIAACKEINPNVRVVGFTATPYRLGKGMVVGDDKILNHICYEAKVADLIRDGYLSPLITKGSLKGADFSSVHIRKGEYVPSEVDDIINTDDVVNAAVAEIVALGADRRAWILFCNSIAHAEHVAQVLQDSHGIEAPVVHSKIPKGRRDKIIKEYYAGKHRAICNVNVLSEGFDAPFIDLVALLRPTKSPGLYYQQVGRGLRLFPGKNNCLVLDFAGNIMEHGPVDNLRIKQPKKTKGDAPVKQCPECQTIVNTPVMECPECGYLWPPSERVNESHDGSSSNAAILSNQVIEPVEKSVVRVAYYRHEKKGKTPSLRVEYFCGLKLYKEWVFLEHTGHARANAEIWWNNRSGLPAPRSISEAMNIIKTTKFIEPVALKVDENGKYPEIKSYSFNDVPVRENENTRPNGEAGRIDGEGHFGIAQRSDHNALPWMRPRQ